jgi:hypothetical protein
MNWARELSRYRLLVAGVVAVAVLVSCAASPVVTAEPVADVSAFDGKRAASVEPTVLVSEVQGTLSGELTAVEVEGLAFMREEEKLARDVYLRLYDRWGLRAFQNIAQSEETHMAAVADLIERYGLEDPAMEEVGVFTNQELQALYDQLIEEGYRSLVDALCVGAAIEEIDILDLEERIEQTDHADIAQVYENLMKGSRNHLRAFVSNLERREGIAYAPQHLSQQAYAEIVGATNERGRAE